MNVLLWIGLFDNFWDIYINIWEAFVCLSFVDEQNSCKYTEFARCFKMK